MSATLRRVREEIVLRHIAGENDRDLAAVMATFTHPRYEIIPTATVYDGDNEVREMILRQWQELPRMHYSAAGVYHGPDGVVIETRTTCPGTDLDMLSVNVFGFEGEDLIVERCYFDRMLLADQLKRAGL
ncbi:hypothetical protein AWC18_18585 [Mycolicibacter nonchromogenicus]|uniref:SnoaL-like domain-containing protein n=1 Tax=Mycolicibacter nonchromogenicus TaxID=1782 RepID=A0A1X1YZ72_MYCNO|nr:nuclear transport factor 2 family protein [Mycolicibacter nonchromogenicus]ORW16385.1 hypothetical protein AWC18_18585 [Mycolicibacter nonchromogenicus]